MTNFEPPSDPVDPIRTQVQIFGFWRDAVREWHKRNEAPLHSKAVLYDIVRKHSDAESTQDNPSWMISKAAEVGLMEQFGSAGTYKLWLPELNRVIEVAGKVVYTPEQLQELLVGTPNWPFDINDDGMPSPSVVTSIALNGASVTAEAEEVVAVEEKPVESSESSQEPDANSFDPETYTLDIELTDKTPKEIRRLALHLLLWRTATPSSDHDWRHIVYETAKSVLRRHGVKKPETVLEGMGRGNAPRTIFNTQEIAVYSPLARLRPVERAHVALWQRFGDASVAPEALREVIRDSLNYAANQVGGVTRVLVKYGWASKNRRGNFILARPLMMPEIEAAADEPTSTTEPEPVAEEPEPETAPEDAEVVHEQTQTINGSKTLFEMSRPELEELVQHLQPPDFQAPLDEIDAKRENIRAAEAQAQVLEDQLKSLRDQIAQDEAEISRLAKEAEAFKAQALTNEEALKPVRFHLENYDLIHAGMPDMPT